LVVVGDELDAVGRRGRRPGRRSRSGRGAVGRAGNLLGEAYTGGPLAGLRITNQYDPFLRRTNLALVNSQGAVLTATAYGYDAASRLSRVSSGTATAGYFYLANSPVVSQIGFTNNGAWRMTTTKAYDSLNRLTEISSVPSGASAVSFAYDYDLANQRTIRREADGSYWRYEYDSLGQVRSGKKYWSDGTPVAGQQFEYAFDDIGNRTGTKAGGDENGVGLRSAAYSANNLNQYTGRDVPGAVDVMGIAFATNVVTVNGQGVYRKGEYFRKELSVNNAAAPVWQQVDVAAPNETTVTRHEFVPKTPETFAYDADGNLTNDGRWQYTWDAENRLIAMTNIASVPDGAKMALTFAYDSRSRRTQKTVYSYSGGAYVPSYTNLFVDDGWNLAVTLTSDLSPLASFTWGLDLSGSPQGAGGVGGLLWMSIPSGTNAGMYFYAYDGNGNVVALVSAADGSIAARYEYGPFGELLRATGPMAKANPFRFSTKYQDNETGLLYYGYRFYDPNTGRWLSRDPIEEEGGLNLYAYVFNNPVNQFDPFGLQSNVIGIPAMIAAGWDAATIAEVAGISVAAAAALIAAEQAKQHGPPVCESRAHGKGERGHTAKPEGTGNPFKHMKPHPTDPTKVLWRDPHTGKWIPKPKPPGFPDPKPQPPKPQPPKTDPKPQPPEGGK
jgi:RHS repeat-associated protein